MKRYNIIGNTDGEGNIYTYSDLSDNGEWVKHSEAIKIIEEIEKLVILNEKFHDNELKQIKMIEDLQARVEQLEQQLGESNSWMEDGEHREWCKFKEYNACEHCECDKWDIEHENKTLLSTVSTGDKDNG